MIFGTRSTPQLSPKHDIFNITNMILLDRHTRLARGAHQMPLLLYEKVVSVECKDDDVGDEKGAGDDRQEDAIPLDSLDQLVPNI
jgi:hypothetical protein